MRNLTLVLILTLVGCTPARDMSLPASTSDTAIEAAHADAPAQEAVDMAATVTENVVDEAVAAVAGVAPPPPPQPTVEPLVAAPAADLIARWEVGSPGQYNRLYKRPVWPKGASGITWCIGYDGGHQTGRMIEVDWAKHANVRELVGTAGLKGSAAQRELPKYRHISTEYPYCMEVFTERSLIEYERRTRRAFGDGYADLRPLARGALVSLVYNRGAAMTGDSRREMRTIRDDCIPRQDYACIAKALREMKRLWKGSSIQNGMYARREAEAILVEST